MDKNLITFFDFIEDSTCLNTKIIEFKNNIELRKSVWNIDNLRNFLKKQDVNDKILNMSWDLSIKAINENEINHLNNSILLLSIENFNIDYRDSLIRLALINFACEKLNINIKELVDSISEYLTSKSLEYFNNFINSTKAEKSLKAMGLRSVFKNKKIDIEQIPPSW